MGRTVLGVIGGAIGGYFGGYAGAAQGFAIGYGVGPAAESAPTIAGPRLDALSFATLPTSMAAVERSRAGDGAL